MTVSVSIARINGPRHEETCLQWFASNTGADQSVHPSSLISAFVVRFLESIISRLDSGEISTFQLVPVAEETDLKIPLSKPQRQVCHDEAKMREFFFLALFQSPDFLPFSKI